MRFSRNTAFVGVFAIVAATGCSHSSAEAPVQPLPVAAMPVSTALPVTSADASVPLASTSPHPARWTRDTDEARARWTYDPNVTGPPLVVRDVVHPVGATEYVPVCNGDFAGARFGAPKVSLDLGDHAPPLHVWMRARGPVGMIVTTLDREKNETVATCALAAANTWINTPISHAKGEATIEIADVDRAGERRGQTSPYVIVVTEEDAAPTEAPDPRAPLGPNDVSVRWRLQTARCPDGMDPFLCYRASVELGGAVTQIVSLPHLVIGQSYCWPHDTGIYCGGASGMTMTTLSVRADGHAEIIATSESDGYCPPEEADHCQSTMTLKTFKLPPGARFVADPAGTFPPAPKP